MGVVIVFQLGHSTRDIAFCARVHAQLNVSAVTARVHAKPKLACTREILSKTAILSSAKYSDVNAFVSMEHLNFQPANKIKSSLKYLL